VSRVEQQLRRSLVAGRKDLHHQRGGRAPIAGDLGSMHAPVGHPEIVLVAQVELGTGDEPGRARNRPKQLGQLLVDQPVGFPGAGIIR
jgi:hypothetical protein